MHFSGSDCYKLNGVTTHLCRLLHRVRVSLPTPQTLRCKYQHPLIMENQSLMKRIFYGLLAASSFGVAAAQTAAEKEMSSLLTEVVAGVTAKLPLMIDDDTELSSVATTRNLMIYTNTVIKFKGEQINTEKLNELLDNTVLAKLCDQKELKAFIDLGVVMVYRYLGNDGVFVTEVSKDMTTCRKP